MPRGRTRSWSDDDLRAAVAASRSVAEVLRRLGLRPVGGNYGTVQRAVHRLRIDTSHFLGAGWRRGSRLAVAPTPLGQVLVSGSTYTNSSSLKGRLLSAGLLRHACAECGVTEWRGAALTLELHRVNGDPSDHRLDNLQLLCPNCHSRTSTYRGRNIGARRWRVRERSRWRNWYTRGT